MPKVRRNLRAEKIGNDRFPYNHINHAEMPTLRENMHDETGGKAEISGATAKFPTAHAGRYDIRYF